MRHPVPIAIPAGVRSVADALSAAGHDAVLVGGAVRDGFLGVASVDFDLVTDATPDEVRAAAAGAGGVVRCYALGERFGTVGLALEGGGVLEVTRYRPDALRLARVSERFAADAGHRDFSANAIGVDLADGAVLDPLDGRRAIHERVLTMPGDPHDRLAEDPIRVLRAARFVAELGFELDLAARDALPAHAHALAAVAPERVRDDLTKLLLGEQAEEGLRLLLECGALAVVLPEVAALDGVTQPSFHDLDVFAHTAQAVGLAPATMVLRWAALLHDVGKAPARTVDDDGRIRFLGHARLGADIAETICRRMRLSNAETVAITHLVAEHMRLGDINLDNPRSVDRSVRKLDLWVLGADPPRTMVTAEDAVELTLADFSATAHRDEAPMLRASLENAVAASRERGTRSVAVSPVSGSELMRMLALSEGPAVGVAKAAVEEAVRSGRLQPDEREKAVEIARAAVGYYLEASDNNESVKESPHE